MAYRLAKTGRISCGMAALSLGLFCCTADDSAVQQPSGALVLKLTADTAGVKAGSIATKALNEFDGFLDEKEYRVQVYQGADTLQSALYKDFPEKIELKEGEYVLRAFKGANLPAAFMNPYFEGTKEFVIKEGMKTPLDVTCTLANTRLFITYTDDFRQAYTDCTVSLRTSYTGDVFLVPQTESRSVYLQTDKTGTDLEVAVTLKRASWTESKTYTVTDPSIALKPQESVNLVLSTDGKTGDGLALSIVLDDRMEELEFEEGIPDFMWKPFEKPTVEANGFISGEKIEIAKGGILTSPSVKFGVPAGVGGLHIWRTMEGSADTLKYDLSIPEELKAAADAGFTLVSQMDNLLGFKGTNAISLVKAINLLERTPGNVPYEFIFFAKDNLPIVHYSDTLHLFVEVMPAAPTVTFASPVLEVVEGEVLEHPVVAELTAEAGLEDVIVTLPESTGEKSYSWAAGTLQDIATLNIDSENKKASLTIFPVFTESLDADFTSDKEYPLTVTVNAERGLEESKSTTETVNVKVLVPRFPLAMTAHEGDVFAKRAVLRANVSAGKGEKLKFQRKDGASWIDVDTDARQIVNQTVQVDTLKGLNPISTYTIRAVYNSGRQIREGEEYTFTTENVGTLPNAGFENWYYTKISDKVYWEVYYPYSENESETKGWDTLNKKTTSEGGTATVINRNAFRYNANSGTLETSDAYSGTKAALIRTVGWGKGNSATGAKNAKYIDPGYLYLGIYNSTTQLPSYGYDFASRPFAFSFYYKYTPSPNDKLLAEIVVQHVENDDVIELGRATFRDGMSYGTYQYSGKIVINYTFPNLSLKANRIYVVFKSGDNASNDTLLEVPSFGNLSDGEYVGSQLYIDDVELIYE